jgi:caffeoyl-CoA O-methyltransferase
MAGPELLWLLISIVAALPPSSRPDRDARAVLESMLDPARRYNNVEPAEGAYLRDLVLQLKAKRVLELGTSTGYSSIWLALGLRQTGGRLITIEYNQQRHSEAVENFRRAGVRELIDARLADAAEEIAKVAGPLDLVFLDAVPQHNLRYYQALLPKVRTGGAIVTHNVKSHPFLMLDFLERIRTDQAVETEIVTPGWQGFSVSRVRQIPPKPAGIGKR